MAESADDPALHWIEPQNRGVLPLDAVHVPSRLRRTIRSTRYRCASIPTTRASSTAAPARGRDATHMDQWAHSVALPRTVPARALSHRRGLERKSTGGRSLWRGNGRCVFRREHVLLRARCVEDRIVYLAARLIHGGFRLLDTQFVTEHLKQFGTIEIDRTAFHRRS